MTASAAQPKLPSRWATQGDDDLVGIDFALVNGSGSPITSGVVSVGDRIGVQMIVEDLRQPIDETFVFAAFVDMMYDNDVLVPADTIPGDDFNFDVIFENDFNEAAAVGTASTPGIIDEFGTLLNQSTAEGGGVSNPNLMATVFFNVVGAGTTKVVGGPADASPFQDTLLFQEDDPIQIDRIRYDVLEFTVASPEPELLHNAARPGDVNNDGEESPIDALLIINYLGREESEGEALASQHFYDVSNDGKASPHDALLIINGLTQKATRGEGELAVALARGASSSDTSAESDSVFADLSEAELVCDFGGGHASGSVALAPINGGADADDDDDDVLGLLADDVSGL